MAEALLAKTKLSAKHVHKLAGRSVDDLVATSVLQDWTKFQPLRGDWITRFTKEVRI